MSRKVQYKLNLPEALYQELQDIAEKEGVTLADLIRRGIKWGLLEHEIAENEGRILIEREKGADPIEVLLL